MKHLGIDTAKRKFDVALILDGKYRTHVFDNSVAGHRQLMVWLVKQVWLVKHDAMQAHACLEATDEYGVVLATFLHDQGLTVSVVNPAQIKGFALCELARTKTDQADAKLIARFCRAHTPPAWQPQAPEIRELQARARRLDALNEMLRMEANRLESAADVVVPPIKHVSEQLEQQIETLR